MTGTSGRRFMAWLVAVAATGAVARVGVVLPERCGAADPDRLRVAAAEAVGWFTRNQHAEGTFVYRVDTRTGEDLGGYNWVRHAGVLLALEQAASAGMPGARAVADRAWAAVDEHVAHFGDRTALLDGGVPTTGGTSLLAVALAEQLLGAGPAPGAETAERMTRLERLGRFAAGQVEPDGSVDELADRSTGAPVPGSQSAFTTGEAMFALARIERLLPGQPWEAPVGRIARYVTTDRADREGNVPDASDHWGAYAVAEMLAWPDAPPLPDALVSWGRRQMGVLSIQGRVESQRTGGGWVRLVRGHDALASGIGTVGEALAAWEAAAALDPRFGPQRAWLAERRACVDGVLADRQVTPQDAARRPPAARDAARGSFEGDGVTQMDDTQHILSALVAGHSLASGPDRDPDLLPRRAPVPRSGWLPPLAAFAALVPLSPAPRRRPAGPADGEEARTGLAAVVGGTAAGVVVLGLLAASGAAVLRALDVSAGTGLLAAGSALLLAGVVRSLAPLLTRSGEAGSPGPGGEPGEPAAPWWQLALVPVLVPSMLRPEVLLLALACGAGGRGSELTAGVAGAAAALAAATAAGHRATRRGRPGGPIPAWPGPHLRRWLERAAAVVTLGAGVAVLVEGIYAI